MKFSKDEKFYSSHGERVDWENLIRLNDMLWVKTLIFFGMLYGHLSTDLEVKKKCGCMFYVFFEWE